MIRSLLFDLDNTLVDRSSAHRAYWEDFLAHHPESAHGADSAVLLQRLIVEDEQGYRPREDYFAWVSTVLPGMEWDAEAFWSDYHNRLASFVQPQPEVNGLIKSLASVYRLAVVSNGSSTGQRKKLEQARLNRLLSMVWISGECGVEKPSAKIFLMALEALDCKPEHALFVGDDPIRDIGGAAQVGCQTCWISDGRQFPQGLKPPDLTIPTVKALLYALDVAQGPGQTRGVVCST